MKVHDLIKLLKSLENEEEAMIKVCTYNGNLASIESIQWDEVNGCYTIYCFGEDYPCEEMEEK